MRIQAFIQVLLPLAIYQNVSHKFVHPFSRFTFTTSKSVVHLFLTSFNLGEDEETRKEQRENKQK
jgi:hypothetical protein